MSYETKEDSQFPGDCWHTFSSCWCLGLLPTHVPHLLGKASCSLHRADWWQHQSLCWCFWEQGSVANTFHLMGHVFGSLPSSQLTTFPNLLGNTLSVRLCIILSVLVNEPSDLGVTDVRQTDSWKRIVFA